MLDQSCETLLGVGPTLAAKLARCGIHSITDLLFHLPFRYQDRTHVTAICDLQAKHWQVVAGRVCKTEIKYGKRRMLCCTIEDNTGLLRLHFFHFNQQQIKAFHECSRILVFGEVHAFGHFFEMIHPEYQLLAEGEAYTVRETLTPIYPSTQGLTQGRLRQFINLALKTHCEALADLEWMSHEELTRHGFYSFPEAIVFLHNPTPDTPLSALEKGQHPALRRLVFDELLGRRLSMQLARQHRCRQLAPAMPKADNSSSRFLNQLPFQLTAAQERVCEEIATDLAQSKPMLRLVQGDVGSGKTVVAAFAAWQALYQGFQVALMAPTELLSEQHFVQFQSWFSPLGIQCRRLNGNMKASERKEVLSLLAHQHCQLLIGTHALFQENVQFPHLGLVIIDEQHRFGVAQRLLLQQKGQQSTPHQLLMTATPIPRTLAMTQFAHMDLSIIDERPPGRFPITTAVMNQEKREPLIHRLRTVIGEGFQVYWVCTLIEESEKQQCMTATATAKNLQEQLPHARVGLIHGRMKTAEKENIMLAFKQGEIHLLVATTVIEVGVDVPKASLMIIENAERLGLSQLHQLRGRVGRGNIQSHCLLLYQPPLSKLSAERLRALKASQDGFILSEKDLQLRGGGDLLGTRQTGYRSFKLAQLARDQALLPAVAGMAKQLVTHQPATAKIIAKRWVGDFESFLQG